jgi:hypothetical protein
MFCLAEHVAYFGQTLLTISTEYYLKQSSTFALWLKSIELDVVQIHHCGLLHLC